VIPIVKLKIDLSIAFTEIVRNITNNKSIKISLLASLHACDCSLLEKAEERLGNDNQLMATASGNSTSKQWRREMAAVSWGSGCGKAGSQQRKI